MLVRPCLLVVDPEDGGISSRKLVLESAHFNVVATYSCEEALLTLERFPRMHGVILNAAMQHADCLAFLNEVRQRFPEPLRFIVGVAEFADADAASYLVKSYAPKALLDTLRVAFPGTAPRVEAESVVV